jgi:hypothetical protein
MEFQHVNVKLFVRHPEDVDLEALIPVFHRWIQTQNAGELFLDVADYRHVHHGPGMVLIGHYGNYSLDNTGGRLGVRYNRKTALEGTDQDRLLQATQAALIFCQRLENEPSLAGAIQIDGHEMEIFLNDRMLAPNTPETRAQAEQEFRTFYATLFANTEYALDFSLDPRGLLSVLVRTAKAFDTATLLHNLNGVELASERR